MSFATPAVIPSPSPDDTIGSPSADPMPLCPLTGQPASRRLQGFSGKLLPALWRIGLRVDVERLFAGVRRMGLYESPCGLMFFDPLIEGDDPFYTDFYARVSAHERFARDLSTRIEYQRAASHIADGAAVLDIGCGRGSFRTHLPHAHYQGLDPFAPADADDLVRRETPAAHAVTHSARYDVVAAFQVLEHLARPAELVRQMLDLARPGGLIILCVPLCPSAITAIPNFLLNAPPHHLTWWNRPAFIALADRFGLEIVELVELPPSRYEGLTHWMERLSFIKTTPGPVPRYFAHRWSWHLSLAASYVLADLAHRIRALPPGGHSMALFLAARKPA